MLSKNILIIDESKFSRVCTAILEIEGYKAKSISQREHFRQASHKKDVGLIITSYPGSAFIFGQWKNALKKLNIPLIILTDFINDELLDVLEGLDNVYCMIKPLDYQRFRYLVKQVMNGEVNPNDGYKIV